MGRLGTLDGLRPLLFAHGSMKSILDGEPVAQTAEAMVALLERAGAAPISEEEREALRGRTFMRAEVKPFMRLS